MYAAPSDESSAIEFEITKFDVFGTFQKSYSANGN